MFQLYLFQDSQIKLWVQFIIWNGVGTVLVKGSSSHDHACPSSVVYMVSIPNSEHVLLIIFFKRIIKNNKLGFIEIINCI